MTRRSRRLLPLCFLILAIAVSSGPAQQRDASGEKKKTRPKENLQQRAESLRTIAERLGVGPGSVIADIGAGKGRDTWTFADIVLEEWATQKDERPPLPENVTMPSVLTEKGDPGLGPEPLDAVFFLDTYHLLFHGPTLLAKLRQRLTDSGVVCVVDRQALKTISHREASHRRMIAPLTVKEEMIQAGFALLRDGPRPAEDRFLLVFGKADTEKPGDGSSSKD